MTTAQEIELKAAEVRMKIEALARGVETMARDIVTYGTRVAIGREVCARRARKLRKRGDDVRYVGRTKTGKARYSWIRRIAPWAFYIPNDLGQGPCAESSRKVACTYGLAGAPTEETK